MISFHNILMRLQNRTFCQETFQLDSNFERIGFENKQVRLRHYFVRLSLSSEIKLIYAVSHSNRSISYILDKSLSPISASDKLQFLLFILLESILIILSDRSVSFCCARAVSRQL